MRSADEINAALGEATQSVIRHSLDEARRDGRATGPDMFTPNHATFAPLAGAGDTHLFVREDKHAGMSETPIAAGGYGLVIETPVPAPAMRAPRTGGLRLVHTADFHLGFRQFERAAPNGVNAREMDVSETAMRAVDLMIAEQPDVIVIGGDVFHQSRPSNNAIRHANVLFRRLRQALPHIPIILVSGNHDAPKSVDAGCILPLYQQWGITVVENTVEEFEFAGLDLYVMAVPDVIGVKRPPLTPKAGFRHRILLMHGEIAGMIAAAPAKPHEVSVEQLHGDQWSYIALGHYHVYRQVAARAFYSGSLDYTSTNPWGELTEQAERGVPGKGFIVHDLDTGAHKFVPVPVARPFVELPSIECAELTTTEIDAQIRLHVETVFGGIDNHVVRIVLRNMPRWRVRELNQQNLREYRLRALNFQVVSHAPDAQALSLDIAAPDKRVTLADTADRFMSEFALPPEVERPAFLAMSRHYMQQAGDVLAAATVEG